MSIDDFIVRPSFWEIVLLPEPQNINNHSTSLLNLNYYQDYEFKPVKIMYLNIHVLLLIFRPVSFAIIIIKIYDKFKIMISIYKNMYNFFEDYHIKIQLNTRKYDSLAASVQ